MTYVMLTTFITTMMKSMKKKVEVVIMLSNKTKKSMYQKIVLKKTLLVMPSLRKYFKYIRKLC